MRSHWLVVMVAATLFGCDTQDPQPEEFYARALGDAGVYEIEVVGEDLVEGVNDLTIHVYRDGAPSEAASVVVRSVMPTMGHPTSEVEADVGATAEYEASLLFSMPGAWDLEVEIGAEPSDSVVFRVEVE